MRLISRPAALAALSLFLAAPPAAAELFETISPNQMVKLIDAEKGMAALDQTGDDTTVDGRVDGVSYTIFFYQCDGGEFTAPAKPDSACLSFEYRAYFSDYPNDSDTVNQWNNDYHFGSLWRDDEGDLALQLNVIVEGGVTDANLRATFAWWRAVIESFEEFMGERL